MDEVMGKRIDPCSRDVGVADSIPIGIEPSSHGQFSTLAIAEERHSPA
jgi:hypothetical protein